MSWIWEEMGVYRFYRWGSIAPARTRGWHTPGRRSRTPRSAPHYLVRSGTTHRGTAVGRGRGAQKQEIQVSSFSRFHLYERLSYDWSVEEKTCSLCRYFHFSLLPSLPPWLELPKSCSSNTSSNRLYTTKYNLAVCHDQKVTLSHILLSQPTWCKNWQMEIPTCLEFFSNDNYNTTSLKWGNGQIREFFELFLLYPIWTFDWPKPSIITFVGIFKKHIFWTPEKAAVYANSILNNLVHIQPHMQDVRTRQSHGKPKGGDETFKYKHTLANQKREEKWRCHIKRNGSAATTMGQCNEELSEVDLILNITLQYKLNKMQETHLMPLVLNVVAEKIYMKISF